MKKRSIKVRPHTRRAPRRNAIPPSPIDRLGWSGRSRNVRLINAVPYIDPEPDAEGSVGGTDTTPCPI